MTPYEQIKAEVIKCCPEILGTHIFEIGYNRCKFCNELRIFVEKQTHNIISDVSGGQSREVTETQHDITGYPCTKNLGSPITLEHLLRTIQKPMYLKTLGNQLRLSDDEGLLGYYDLTLPLASQSEETLKAIAELLSKK